MVTGPLARTGGAAVATGAAAPVVVPGAVTLPGRPGAPPSGSPEPGREPSVVGVPGRAGPPSGSEGAPGAVVVADVMATVLPQDASSSAVAGARTSRAPLSLAMPASCGPSARPGAQ